MHAGDTVSFVRDFRWFNARTWRQDTNNFFSRDTLTYVVELANAHDSGRYRTRLAVIDSFGVMPCTTLGAPRFFSSGTRAVFTRVNYVVPASMEGKPVFMRVRVRARGSGEYFFTRTDDYTVNYSGLLTRPGIITHINVLNQNKYWAKTTVQEDSAGITSGRN